MKAPESEDVTESQSNRLLLLTGTNMANKTPGRADEESGKRAKLGVSIPEEMTAMRNWAVGSNNLKGHLWHGTYKIFAMFAFLLYVQFSGCLASRSPYLRFVSFGNTIAISWKGIPKGSRLFCMCCFFRVREDKIQAKRLWFIFILTFWLCLTRYGG